MGVDIRRSHNSPKRQLPSTRRGAVPEELAPLVACRKMPQERPKGGLNSISSAVADVDLVGGRNRPPTFRKQLARPAYPVPKEGLPDRSAGSRSIDRAHSVDDEGGPTTDEIFTTPPDPSTRHAFYLSDVSRHSISNVTARLAMETEAISKHRLAMSEDALNQATSKTAVRPVTRLCRSRSIRP